jgi:hypothetical protein
VASKESCKKEAVSNFDSQVQLGLSNAEGTVDAGSVFVLVRMQKLRAERVGTEFVV